MARAVNGKEIAEDFERFVRHEAMRMYTTQDIVLSIIEEKLNEKKEKL